MPIVTDAGDLPKGRPDHLLRRLGQPGHTKRAA
jgi:hypothetical protein